MNYVTEAKKIRNAEKCEMVGIDQAKLRNLFKVFQQFDDFVAGDNILKSYNGENYIGLRRKDVIWSNFMEVNYSDKSKEYTVYRMAGEDAGYYKRVKTQDEVMNLVIEEIGDL